MGTIANVLTGVATLGIRQPNDAIAEWDAVNFHAGTHSAKLTKTGTGNAGITSLTIKPPSITFAAWDTDMNIGGRYTFYYLHQLGITGNYTGIGFRFDDPDSDNGHIEISAVPFHNHAGLGIWTLFDFNDAAPDGTPFVGYYGENEVGTRMDSWALTATTKTINAIIDGLTIDGDADNWVLTEVFFSLYESSPARYACIDTVVIGGVAYAIEPGDTVTPGLSLSSPFTDIGYTEDGVTLEYTADTADIEVEEETFPIDRVITKETCAVTCNMAESSLFNIDKAMAGSLLAGSILKLGAGTMKTMNLKIAGTNPSGFNREIFIPVATSTGAVGMSYKKGEKTVVPVTFQALKGDSPAVTIVDNAA